MRRFISRSFHLGSEGSDVPLSICRTVGVVCAMFASGDGVAGITLGCVATDVCGTRGDEWTRSPNQRIPIAPTILASVKTKLRLFIALTPAIFRAFFCTARSASEYCG